LVRGIGRSWFVAFNLVSGYVDEAASWVRAHIQAGGSADNFVMIVAKVESVAKIGKLGGVKV
jgi:hypothetical protein